MPRWVVRTKARYIKMTIKGPMVTGLTILEVLERYTSVDKFFYLKVRLKII